MDNKEQNREETQMNDIGEKLKKADAMIHALTNEDFKENLAKELARQIASEIVKVVVGASTPPHQNIAIKTQIQPKYRGIPANKKDEYFELENAIDRTAYPEIQQLESTLDKSLFVLKIAAEKGHEWLSPAGVYKILFQVFKQLLERPAVKMALSRATLYAQRQKQGKNVLYRLADAGEKYLTKKIAEINNHTGSTAEEPKPNLSSEETSDNSEIAN